MIEASELETAMADLVALTDAALRAPSAEKRALAALEAYNYNRQVVGPAIAAQRRSAVRELRAIGYTLQGCAELLGVSDSRIAQITGA